MQQGSKSELLRQLAEAGDNPNMWEAGQRLGLERDQTEYLALELMGEGLLEIVNLSGVVRLTQEGQRSLGGGPAGGQGQDLSSWLAELEAAGELGLPPAAAADLAADLAGLRAQLGRSQPLEAVVEACLSALDQTLAQATDPAAAQLRQRLAALKG